VPPVRVLLCERWFKANLTQSNAASLVLRLNPAALLGIAPDQYIMAVGNDLWRPQAFHLRAGWQPRVFAFYILDYLFDFHRALVGGHLPSVHQSRSLGLEANALWIAVAVGLHWGRLRHPSILGTGNMVRYESGDCFIFGTDASKPKSGRITLNLR